jgi:hypothetical protein
MGVAVSVRRFMFWLVVSRRALLTCGACHRRSEYDGDQNRIAL